MKFTQHKKPVLKELLKELKVEKMHTEKQILKNLLRKKKLN